VSESAASPAVIVSANAIAIPASSMRPKLLITGAGQSSRTRKPAPVATTAVAMFLAPRAAASTAAAGGEASPSRASANRAWNWIA
jgi:hypothetical protein